MLIAKFNDSAANSEYYSGILLTPASNEQGVQEGGCLFFLHAPTERKGESCAAARASLEDFGLLIGGNEIVGEKVFCSAGGRLVKEGGCLT